jgi:hypothetical protein
MQRKQATITAGILSTAVALGFSWIVGCLACFMLFPGSAVPFTARLEMHFIPQSVLTTSIPLACLLALVVSAMVPLSLILVRRRADDSGGRRLHVLLVRQPTRRDRRGVRFTVAAAGFAAPFLGTGTSFPVWFEKRYAFSFLLALLLYMVGSIGSCVGSIRRPEPRRKGRPKCPQCGYVLYYARGRRCPECGRPFRLDEVSLEQAEVRGGVLEPKDRSKEQSPVTPGEDR